MPGAPPERSPSTPFEQTTYVRRLASDLRQHLHRLLAVNLLFTGAALPSSVLFLAGFPLPALLAAVPTVAPAWVALVAYTGTLARGEDAGSPWIVWRRAFGRMWPRASLLGGLVIGIGATAWFALTLDLGEASPLRIALRVGVLLVAAFLAVVLLEAAGVLALYDTSLGHAIRNAVVLVLAHPLPTLALALYGLLLAWLTTLLAFGPGVIVPALFAVCLTHTTLDLVARHRPA